MTKWQSEYLHVFVQYDNKYVNYGEKLLFL